MIVNICGTPHEVIEQKETFEGENSICGQIDYKRCKIYINEDMSQDMKNETLCHEMLHGMLVHHGYNDMAENEQFVQSLACAINQGFLVKPWSSECNGMDMMI